MSHLGLAHEESNTTIPAVLFLVPSGFKFKCKIAGIESKATMTGAVIGRITETNGAGKVEVNKAVKSITLGFRQSGGKQQLTELLLSLKESELMAGQVLKFTSVLGSKETMGIETEPMTLSGLPAGKELEIELHT